MPTKSNSILDKITVGDVMSSPPFENLIYVSADTALSDVFYSLAHADILCVPVMDRDERCVGLVDVLDCVKVVQHMYKKKQGQNPGANGDTVNVDTLREAVEDMNAASAINLSKRNPFIPVSQDTPLSQALAHLATGVHRLPVVESLSDPKPKINYFLSQTDVINWMHQNMDSNELVSSLSKQSLSSLGLGTREVDNMTIVFCIESNCRAIEAFRLMHKAGVSGLGVLDDSTRLVDTISASDLRGIRPDRFENLTNTVYDYLRWARSHEVSTHRNARNQVQTSAADRELIWCTRDSSLSEVVNRMVEGNVHRIFTVIGNKEPIGVVSMTDICRVLATSAKEN